MVDINVAPAYTLDMVESIARHPQVHLQGVLMMLKLLDWQLAADIPQWLERVRSWGFRDARARQLQFNRQEICIAASRVRRRGQRRRAVEGARPQ